MHSKLFYSQIGTYNDMKKQTGYCKMTGFKTVSRSTSSGPALFTSGRVEFGVGMSQYQFGGLIVPSVNFKTEGQLVCGMCINITKIDNFPILNNELTNYTKINSTSSHIAMVFDQCDDPICTSGFLDIDIYVDDIFHQGFTQNIHWTAIDCPTFPNERREYLLCSDITCNANSIQYLNASTFKTLFNPRYIQIVVRNTIRPISSFYLMINNTYVPLNYISASGYTWESWEAPFNEKHFNFKLKDYLGNIYYESFLVNDILNLKPNTNYHGGVLF
jgi:hypothetical protein